MSQENIPFIPDDDPFTEKEGVATPRTYGEWLQEVIKLENERDRLTAAILERDGDPSTDPDRNFLLGKLAVASQELISHSFVELEAELDEGLEED